MWRKPYSQKNFVQQITAALPDVTRGIDIACVDGRFYGFEVKTETGKPTKLQEATIRKILKAGGAAVIVRSVDEVRAVIEAPLR